MCEFHTVLLLSISRSRSEIVLQSKDMVLYHLRKTGFWRSEIEAKMIRMARTLEKKKKSKRQYANSMYFGTKRPKAQDTSVNSAAADFINNTLDC